MFGRTRVVSDPGLNIPHCCLHWRAPPEVLASLSTVLSSLVFKSANPSHVGLLGLLALSLQLRATRFCLVPPPWAMPGNCLMEANGNHHYCCLILWSKHYFSFVFLLISSSMMLMKALICFPDYWSHLINCQMLQWEKHREYQASLSVVSFYFYLSPWNLDFSLILLKHSQCI